MVVEVRGSMARALTQGLFRSPFTACQLPPPSELLKIPRRSVPAKRVVGRRESIASAFTYSPSGPIGVQAFRAVVAMASRAGEEAEASERTITPSTTTGFAVKFVFARHFLYMAV